MKFLIYSHMIATGKTILRIERKKRFEGSFRKIRKGKESGNTDDADLAD